MPKRLVIIFFGVSGCGKSTAMQQLAQYLSSRINDRASFICETMEGDQFHPQQNIDKMRNGVPLTDVDREPWLKSMNQHMISFLERCSSTSDSNQALIAACSALKVSYRRWLTDGLEHYADLILFVHLSGSYQVMQNRVLSRTHQFMPASLLQSQFEALEVPDDKEIAHSHYRVLSIQLQDDTSIEQVNNQVIHYLNQESFIM